MNITDPAGYSEAAAHVFTWLADKVLGGTKKAFGWGWDQAKWAAACHLSDDNGPGVLRLRN